jgi:plastocyanin domain-containing protein
VAPSSGREHSPEAPSAAISDGSRVRGREQMVLVQGGYTPDVIMVEPGKPVRLTFVRQ